MIRLTDHTKGIFFLLIISYVLLSVQAHADTIPQHVSAGLHDSTQLEVRKFDPEKIKSLKEDPSFDYGQGPAAISLWKQFLMWLVGLIDKIFDFSGSTNWTNVLIITVSIIVLTYVIMRLLKVDALKIFYGISDKRTVVPGALHEDIHEMDFETLVKQALESRNHRLAIRLLFLQALKMLSDKQYIHWKPGKTNHDYLYELKEASLKEDFDKLNYYFEYAWYGNFAVHEEHFQKAKTVFNDWKNRI